MEAGRFGGIHHLALDADEAGARDFACQIDAHDDVRLVAGGDFSPGPAIWRGVNLERSGPEEFLVGGGQFIAVDQDDAADIRITGEDDLGPGLLLVVRIKISRHGTIENGGIC